MKTTMLLLALTAWAGVRTSLGQGPPPLQDVTSAARPSLAHAADTNSWEAYFDYAVGRLKADPRGAERAFYWASRIDPSRAEPLYGRWVAYWMRFPGWFEAYIQDRPEVVQAPTVLQVDSLFQLALFRNPLMARTLTVLLYDQLPGRWGTDRFTVALLAYGAGKYDRAAAGFGALLREDPAKNYRMRYVLALCLTAAERYDSAATELRALLEDMRKRDEKQLAHFYESKELVEYSLALLRLATGDRTGARAALQRALVENIAFYPAHATLGEVALLQGDRATAWPELEQAVELAPRDGVLHYRYGTALARAGRYADAEPQLRKAIELEPWFALPYYTLGTVLEKRADPRQALDQYRAFAQRAARTAPELDQALARIEALSVASGDTARRP